ncbi:hypothetical protein CFOL_v3_03687 [Cephalotus follicularis]|uniref:DUF7787 domain-containing protein n=1 Tax=Cephalotus follicularis TaxID=3775 RepID=A0A1Q3AWN3_CEPFO|nr:hypothetical protein CFOL_v3_03687 [Cephalotus follicularis]
MRKKKEKKNVLSLEDYIDFLLAHKQLDYTANLLNQIISMHGFKRIHKVQKKVLTDATEALDLIDPSRSTLKESISSCACVTLDDVVADLNELEWQECSVTSIQTFNSTKHTELLQTTTADVSIPKSKRGRRRKVEPVPGGGVGVDDGATGGGCFPLGASKKKRIEPRTRGGFKYYGSGSPSGLVSFGSC